MLIVILKSTWFDMNPIGTLDYLSREAKAVERIKGDLQYEDRDPGRLPCSEAVGREETQRLQRSGSIFS